MPPAAFYRGLTALCLFGTAVAATALTPAPPAPAPDGKTLYESRCAHCHGTTGAGDGPAGGLLIVAPRDFTKGIFKLRSTASGSLPTDDDLMRVVANGIPGTAMTGWKDLLPEADRRAIVAHVKTLVPRFATGTPQPVTLEPEPPATPAAIEAGRVVYDAQGCAACHGDAGRDATAAMREFDDAWGHPLAPAHLTEPWTFRGGASPADVAMHLKAGLDGTPMPPLAGSATDTEIWNLTRYVGSLARKPAWEMNADELKAHYAALDADRAAHPLERGRELAQVCAHCHSPVDTTGRILPGMKFAGGLKVQLSVWDTAVTMNLTSDKETGLGRYTDDEILRVVTQGIRKDGSRMLPFPMGWTAYAHWPEADRRALVAYLRTIPPVRNAIPARVSPGFFPFLADKFRMLLGGVDKPLVFYAGNAGTSSPATAGR
jgi:mono/diheme cytochrome c family protein